MTLTLSEAIANAYLFAGDAKTDSKGLVRVLSGDGAITFSSYDDYLYLEQTVDVEDAERFEAWIDKKTLKELGEVGLTMLDIEKFEDDHGVRHEFLDLTDMLWTFDPASLTGFTFPSDRWGKLSRIKGDEPCVITLGSDQGMKLAKFTKGPSVQGMMAFLEESK